MKLIEMHPLVFTRGHTRKLSTPDVVAALQERKIGNVLNVSPSVDMHLERACHDNGIRYRWVPLVDGPCVDEQMTWIAVRFLEAQMALGNATVVHCNAGRNRTGLVVGLALVRQLAVEPEVVLQVMRTARPGILHNSVFERYLLAYGKE